MTAIGRKRTFAKKDKSDVSSLMQLICIHPSTYLVAESSHFVRIVHDTNAHLYFLYSPIIYLSSKQIRLLANGQYVHLRHVEQDANHADNEVVSCSERIRKGK